MKTIRLLFTLLFAVGLTVNTKAQSEHHADYLAQYQYGYQAPAIDHSPVIATTTDTLRVSGKCDMCKARIEKAALGAGADKATWEAKTQKLAVTYDPAKTDTDKLSKKLASVGHDTEKYKAPDDVYEKLPACCHYERIK